MLLKELFLSALTEEEKVEEQTENPAAVETFPVPAPAPAHEAPLHEPSPVPVSPTEPLVVAVKDEGKKVFPTIRINTTLDDFHDKDDLTQ